MLISATAKEKKKSKPRYDFYPDEYILKYIQFKKV